MNDMTKVTVPRSDQINADSPLLPMTVTVKDVKISGGQEQPVSIGLVETDLFFRPCKSMSRILVAAWGPDASKYAGRSMTLYNDPNVQFGGMKTGGIRISHLSHIEKQMIVALTATRAKRAPFTVQPLVQPSGVQEMIDAYGAATVLLTWDSIENDRRHAWPKLSATDKAKLKAASDEAKLRLTTTSAADDQEPPPGMQEETL